MTSVSRRSFCAASAGVGLLLASCNLNPGFRHRYRITVEVDTPQGLRSGSSVWQVTSREGSGIPDRNIRSEVKAEAVAVDLPGGTLFALLRGQDMRGYAPGLLSKHIRRIPPPGLSSTSDWKEIQRYIEREKPAFDLSPDEYPLLVRFRDINDPATVEKVDPNALGDAFDAGVRLRGIHVEVTDDDVTESIGSRLPWLKREGAALQRCPNFMPLSERPLPCLLTYSNFRK